MIQTYPSKEEESKPSTRHCYIEYYQGDAVEEPVKIFLVEDENSISNLIKVGFKRKDMQSLMMSEYYSYVTTDTIRGNSKIEEMYRRGERVAKELIEKHDLVVPEQYDR
ncbi:MAG: hypothetical protein AAF620_14210 [Bacteroidota bacterium]